MVSKNFMLQTKLAEVNSAYAKALDCPPWLVVWKLHVRIWFRMYWRPYSTHKHHLRLSSFFKLHFSIMFLSSYIPLHLMFLSSLRVIVLLKTFPMTISGWVLWFIAIIHTSTFWLGQSQISNQPPHPTILFVIKLPIVNIPNCNSNQCQTHFMDASKP